MVEENRHRLREGARPPTWCSACSGHSEVLKEARASLSDAMGLLPSLSPEGQEACTGWEGPASEPLGSAEPDPRASVRIRSQGSATPGGHRLPVA